MKRSFVVTLVVGGLFMASCTEDVYNPDRIKEEYEQNFVDLFGEINPNQDWNVAELKSVTVDPGSSTEVKIYALNGDVYKLVGDYKEVSGTQTLTFDAAKGVNDFIVSVGGQGKLVKNGETVSFADAGTRSYNKWDWNGAFTVKDDYVNFPWNDVMAYADRLPDDKPNVDVDGLSTNFDLVMGREEITVYPVYWNAAFKHTLGIYWYDERNKRQTQDIYTDKEGNDVQVYVKRTEDTQWGRPDTYEGWENVTWDTFEKPADVTTGGNWPWGDGTKTYKGEIATSYGINSRGFTIDLPEGTEYGFYIKVDNDNDGRYENTFYTDPSENRNNEGKGKMAAYFKQEMENGTTRTFVGFEDQYNNRGDKKDLNDLMLMIDPSPIVIDNDVTKWIVAAEDLGATDDYDFNDVVFSVEHASGHDEAIITPLAAGGSLETYLYRNGSQIGDEFHALLGGSANADGSYSQINTTTAGSPGSPITIEVPVDFSLAYNDTENIGGFGLKIAGKETIIEAPGKGEVPQMICVPEGWKWPKERVRIDLAYPKFGEWGTNYQSEWYNEPVDGQVIGD